MLDISTAVSRERGKKLWLFKQGRSRERYTIVDVDANERRSECEGEEAWIMKIIIIFFSIQKEKNIKNEIKKKIAGSTVLVFLAVSLHVKK